MDFIKLDCIKKVRNEQEDKMKIVIESQKENQTTSVSLRPHPRVIPGGKDYPWFYLLEKQYQ